MPACLDSETDNLKIWAAVLCRSCNSTKGNKQLDDLPEGDRRKLVKAASEFEEYWKGDTDDFTTL